MDFRGNAILTILAIPFYRRPDLAIRIIENLKDMASELCALGIKIILVNDSPDDSQLNDVLENAKNGIGGNIPKIIRNEQNLGFLKSVNKVFTIAIEAKCDVIVLNSDCLLTPGALTELIDAASLDEKIAFACPRSNNATIASLPHESQFLNLDLSTAHADFNKVSSFLPKHTYVPTAVGFCFLARWEILQEIGLFDEAYGAGYQEENDLVMRASRLGYRAVMANHAFVWHEGSQSFSQTSKTPKARDAENVKIINKRYPEFSALVNRYNSSAIYRAEKQITAATIPDLPIVLFDFSHVGPYHNGTFEAATSILKACLDAWSENYSFGVICPSDAWEFHNLAKLGNLHRAKFGDRINTAAAIVRVGQPFDIATLNRLYDRAPISVIYMLDTIAMDCGYSDVNFDPVVWQLAMKYTDLVFAISEFTRKQLQLRFSVGPKTSLETSYLSLDLGDYNQGAKTDETATHDGYTFVVGNSFPHKFVNETADALAQKTSAPVVALGYKGHPSNSKIRAVNSGSLTEAEIEKLWTNSSVVVFPSHYEGFGFPLLHALAKKKVVFARESELNRELKGTLATGGNIYLFRTTVELAEMFAAGVPSWLEKAGKPVQNWQSAADQLMDSVESKLKSVSYDFLLERIAFVSSMATSKPLDTRVTPAAKIGRQVEIAIERVLQTPGVKAILKPAYELFLRK